jgi:hypothetical protein
VLLRYTFWSTNPRIFFIRLRGATNEHVIGWSPSIVWSSTIMFNPEATLRTLWIASFGRIKTV